MAIDRKRLKIEVFSERDIPVLAPLQRASFDEDSLLFTGKPGGPDGYDDGSFLRKWALSPQARAFTAYLDDTPVGAAIVFVPAPGEYFLGHIFADPAFRGEGLGSAIWAMLEERFPDASVWRTETVGYSQRNHYFYVEKCGFAIVGIAPPNERGHSTYRLLKRMKEARK